MDVSRMMQGAHFLSHNVATAFVSWFGCLALYEVVLRRHDERRFPVLETDQTRAGARSAAARRA